MARPARLETRTCENCGKDVTRKPSSFREHVFCSHGCYSRSAYRRHLTETVNARLSPRIAANCPKCGKQFDLPPSKSTGLNFCSVQCRHLGRRSRQVTAQGYALVFIGIGEPGATKSGHILEHRKVMQGILGRPLLADENVHHINGVRDDNRAENLELWSRSQPSGQRVPDKLRWAREFIQLYEGTPLQE